MSKPPIVVELNWTRALEFSGRSDKASITLDSAGIQGPSPVEALGFALAGCMLADLTHILRKGRHPFRAVQSRLVGERAQQDPHRFVRIAIHFTIEGDAPPEAVARAIEVSRARYCSVWHSLRQDIELTTTFDVQP